MNLDIDRLIKVRRLLCECIDTCKPLGYQRRIAQALNNIGLIHQKRKEYDSVLKCYEQAASIFKQLGDQRNFAHLLFNLATIYDIKKEHKIALKQFFEVLQVYQKHENLGDEFYVAKVLNSIAITFINMGQYDEAEKHLKESLRIKTRLGDQLGVAYTPDTFGGLNFRKQKYDIALRQYEDSLLIKRKLMNLSVIAQTLDNIFSICFYLNDFDKAELHIRESLEICERMKDIQGINIASGKLEELNKRRDKLQHKKPNNI
jgi:tetratricopeptide (TPR) repeat protein